MRSLLARLLTRQGTVTPGVVDQTTNAADSRFFGWMVDWLDEDLDGARLLDAGCWNAPLGVYLRAAGAEVDYIGTDLSRAALRSARGFDRTLRVASADLARRLPFASATFDGVALIQTYEHLPRGAEPAMIRALAELVKPGGWLVLSTELNSVLNPLDPAWFFGHRHYWPGKLASVLRAAGLDIEATHVNGGLWQCMDTNALYVAKHVLRRPYRTPTRLRALAEREYEGVPRWRASRVWFKSRRAAR